MLGLLFIRLFSTSTKILCITIAILSSRFDGATVSGASVVSTNVFHNQDLIHREGCTLVLPSNRLFAPSITDEVTREALLPAQDKRDANKFYVHVNKDKNIRVDCGRGNTLSFHETFYYMRLTCVKGAEFRDNEDELILLAEGIQCDNPRKPTPIVYRNGTCSGKGTHFNVEFLTETPPRKYYSTCVDEETSGTWYSSSYIDGASFANGLVEGSGNRPDFRGQEFYPFAIKQAYKWENAFEHLSDLLGSEELVNKYFPSQQYRFSRGHLFPNADAVKRFEKHATFYYLNTVPQWQILNGGNWVIVEQDVRDLAKDLGKTLQVVTGSFGVTSLYDENNNDIPIWLARDNTGKLRLPVPRFVWKVVHDPAASAAVAIVQVNNPWVFRADSDVLCNDVCGSLAWLRSSDFLSIRKGYTYCCDVNELRRTIPFVPRVQYTTLLGVGHVVDNQGDDDIDSDSEDDEEESDSYDDNSSSSSSGEDHRNYRIKGFNHKSPPGVVNPSHSIAELFANVQIGG